MTVHGLVSALPDAVAVGYVPTATRRNGSQRWARRKENVKDRQNRQCLFCGRRSGRRLQLEIHHVKKQEHGGGDAFRNVLGACHACHRLIHNVERGMPFVARLSLIVQVVKPESMLATWVSRILFRCFLKSSGASAFHPAALVLRPLRTEPCIVAREGVA